MALTHQLVVRVNQVQSDLLNHVVDLIDVKKSTLLRGVLVGGAVGLLFMRSRKVLPKAEPEGVVKHMLDGLPDPLRHAIETMHATNSDESGNDPTRSPLLEDADIGQEFEALLSKEQMEAMAEAFLFAGSDDDEEFEDEDVLFDSAEAVLIALLRRDPREYADALTTLFSHSDEKLSMLLAALEEEQEEDD